MSVYGDLLRSIAKMPAAMEALPAASGSDYALVARRLEETATKLRILGDCRDAGILPAPRNGPPGLRLIEGGARVRG